MKQPLVLLHGWGVNSLIWDPILPKLETWFDLTRIDLPGFGNDIDYAGSYSMDPIIEKVLARAPSSANWVAWSLGATIAMEAAIAYPDRFLKLQLVSPTPKFLRGEHWDHGVDLKAFESLATGFDENYEKALQRFLLLQVHSNDRAQLKSSRAMVRQLANSINQLPPPTPRSLRGSLQLLADTDLRHRLRNLKSEIQVVAGSRDQVIPVAASEALFAGLPNGNSIHVLDAGHLVFLEQTTKYIGALTQFFASNS